MVNEIKNSLNGAGLKVAIAVARFNEVVTDKLLEGAVRELELLGVADKDITVVHVPGAFELPGVCRRLAFPYVPTFTACDQSSCLFHTQ